MRRGRGNFFSDTTKGEGDYFFNLDVRNFFVYRVYRHFYFCLYSKVAKGGGANILNFWNFGILRENQGAPKNRFA